MWSEYCTLREHNTVQAASAYAQTGLAAQLQNQRTFCVCIVCILRTSVIQITDILHWFPVRSDSKDNILSEHNEFSILSLGQRL
jgi:hypothetical protein